jgi:threonine dehydrogenase-like Zn-dependent dehydrogenase
MSIEPNKVVAAVAKENHQIELLDFDFPKINSTTGTLKIEMTGMCGSDWPYFLNYPQTKGPMILGHETVGHVHQIGIEAFSRWGVKEGDRVALEEYLPCGHCHYCRTGDFRLCDETDTLLGNGVRYGSTPIAVQPSLWGGYARYQYLHANTVFHKIPVGMSSQLATLALPLGNGVEWANIQGRAGLGKCVVIQGPGQQGLACTVAAHQAGASQIIVTGLKADHHRLSLAKELGAHHTIAVDDADLLESIADLTGGLFADVVIDCSSGGEETVLSAIQIARKGGLVLLCGRKGVPIKEFHSDQLFKKHLTVRGMRGHSYQAVEMAISIIASGQYPLQKLCTHTFKLGDLDLALKTVGGKGLPNAIHCCIDPWKDNE